MYEGPVQDVIDELSRLPGIGPKSAQRLAFHLLSCDKADVARLASALIQLKERVGFCRECWNMAAEETCRICRDSRRSPTQLCVVEEPRDVIAVEKTQEYKGLYHVLGGALSPLDGVTPDKLRVRELLHRVREGKCQEVILCLNPTVDGEATAAYLARELEPFDLIVTRIASGLPVGGDLEYADEVTLGRALAGRRRVTAGQGPVW